jgi:hypothetical protein
MRDLPTISQFAERLAFKLADILPSIDLRRETTTKKLAAVVRCRDDLDPRTRQMLVNALRALAARAERIADRLSYGKPDA